MKRFTGSLLASLALATASVPAAAQFGGAPIAAPAEPGAIPLYGDKTPGSTVSEVWNGPAAHRMVRNVTRPTLTPVLPDPAKATGAAVVVAPGGGFMMLSMDAEGWLVAKALADRGIAAFVLKYRLIQTPVDSAQAMRFMGEKMRAGLSDPSQTPPMDDSLATEDGLAALAMVRGNAAKWSVDPARVGMIGFSAGAMTALSSVLKGQPGQAPAFFGYIYGPQAKVVVPAKAPPMFDAIAMDDMLFPTQGFPIVEAWRAAKRPVELHAYERGNHGFGLGQPGQTTTLMIDQFTAWMRMHGLLRSTLGL